MINRYKSSSQRDFDSFFASKNSSGEITGGVYWIDSFHPDDRLMMTSIKKNFQKITQEIGKSHKDLKESIPIYFDYLNFIEINAFAAKNDSNKELYFIGMNTGLFSKFFILFESILAATPIFPDHEKPEFKKIDIGSILRSFPIDTPKYGIPLPDESPRKTIAAQCAMIAYEYIFFHELGHILHGHVDRALNCSQNFKALGETSDIGVLNLSSEERHAMEIDADVNAIRWSLLSFYRGNPIQIGSFFGFDKIKFETYLTLLMFSLVIAIHSFNGLNQKFVKENYFGTHPHPELRFNYIYSQVYSTVEQLLPDHIEYLNQYIEHGIVQGSLACSYQFKSGGFPNAFDDSNKDRILYSHMEEFEETYLKSEEKWKPYKKNIVGEPGSG